MDATTPATSAGPDSVPGQRHAASAFVAPTTVTDVIASIAVPYAYDRLPDDVKLLARHCLLDWMGVAIAGGGERATMLLTEELLSGNRLSAGSHVFGSRAMLSPRDAAFVNGVAGHVLDFDDVLPAVSGHASAPLLPALVALGEELDSGLGNLLAAFVAGFEAQGQLGSAVAPGHYRRGFHATATIGTFGAVVGCCALLGLNREQILNALGIASTSAAGLKSAFGTMSKSLQVGHAASNGLMAARLAGRGFTGATQSLDHQLGFIATHTDTFASDGLTGEILWHIRNNIFKNNASCFLTQASIEAIQQLRRENHLGPDDVEAIVVSTNPGHLDVCNIETPRTGLEAKFSLRFTSALAVVSDDLSAVAFSTDRVQDPELVALRERVTVRTDPSLHEYVSGAEITTKDGSTHARVVDMLQVAETRDIGRQEEQLRRKFLSLAGPVIGDEAADTLAEGVLTSGADRPVRGLMQAIQPA
jgi:2-methylcitrate dehydratase PrpD